MTLIKLRKAHAKYILFLVLTNFMLKMPEATHDLYNILTVFTLVN